MRGGHGLRLREEARPAGNRVGQQQFAAHNAVLGLMQKGRGQCFRFNVLYVLLVRKFG